MCFPGSYVCTFFRVSTIRVHHRQVSYGFSSPRRFEFAGGRPREGGRSSVAAKFVACIYMCARTHLRTPYNAVSIHDPPLPSPSIRHGPT